MIAVYKPQCNVLKCETRNAWPTPQDIREVTAVRFRPSVKAALQKAALDDARTVNALMEKIAMDWLKERGYPKDKRKLRREQAKHKLSTNDE